MVKNLPAVWKNRVQSLGQEDPLELEMANHSSILAWRIPLTEEPDGVAGSDTAEHTAQHFIKRQNKGGIEKFFKPIKGLKGCEKLIAIIILNDARLDAFLPLSGTKQRCLLLPLLFSIILEVLAGPVKQEKVIKGIWIGKEEIKLYLFSDDMILYVEKPRNP